MEVAFLYGAVFVALVAVLLRQAINKERDETENVWQDLAEKWQMPVVFDSTPGRAKLKNIYKGHEVTLNISDQPSTGVVTGVSLHRRQKLDQPISTKDEQFVERQLEQLAAVRFPRLPLKQIHIPTAEIWFSKNTRTVSYEQPNLINDPDHLHSLLDPLGDILEIYLTLAAQGSAAMPVLEKFVSANGVALPQLTPSLLQQTLNNLIEEISQESLRLGARASKLLCPDCLTRFKKHKLKLSWRQSVGYYGCRVCHQSTQFFQGQVSVVLDNQMDGDYIQDDGLIHLNWLSRQTLSDFDKVHIIQATDEEVERFVVQIGNDTDEFRRPRYQEITCKVSSECSLSENTIRILRRTFGDVISDQKLL